MNVRGTPGLRREGMLCIVCGLLLTACGGGGSGGGDGGGSSPPINAAPTARFTAAPVSGSAPLAVQLDASGSSDSDGSIATYTWSFGDNTPTASGATTSHTFQAPGTYTVSLTVTDNHGATGSMTSQITASQAGAGLANVGTVDVGDMNACAVDRDGQAWCWGPNSYGQLGTGDTTEALAPRRAAQGFAFRKVSVSTGGAFACGITTADKAYCWGSQEGGRLGDGTMAAGGAFVTSPVPVAGGLSFTDIAAGGDHACGIAANGSAYCWGHNEQGQLGTGNQVNHAAPVAVAGGHSFVSITTHQTVSCAVRTDGAGYCWGNGFAGTLGNGSTASSNVPVAINGSHKFASLRLGVWTACGVTTTGDGYCWGFNGSGELGIGSKTPDQASEPLKVVGGQAWKSISPGVAVTCGVTTDSRGMCWGGNSEGERGDGPFPSADVTSPVAVAGDLSFKSIDADWCSCGVAGDAAYCWGPGRYGCIGSGATANRGVPTPVAGP